eukprot:symbB.v1.2.020916.t1/scaffold1785.1/size101431/4
MPKREVEFTPPNTCAKRLEDEDFTPAKPTKKLRTAARNGRINSWKNKQENPDASDGGGSQSGSDFEFAASSSVLSEALERCVWSDDEDEPAETADRGNCEPSECNQLVPLPPSSGPLQSLQSLTLPQNLLEPKEADFGLGHSVVAYGRRKGSGIAAFEAVEAKTPLLALPPPTPLTKLPPLSELFEVGRASKRAAQAAKLAAPQVPDPTDWLYPPRPYPSHAWKWDGPGPAPRQGERGFRHYTRQALERFRQSSEEDLKLNQEALPLQRYQLRVAFLLHPLSPLSRLLVVHATGSGKTRTVLACADSFYRSGRATCLFFPEEAVKENFYQEILKFPGAWRDFFCACMDVANWRQRRYRCWSPEEIAEYNIAEVETCLGMERKIRLGEISNTFLEEWSQAHPDVPPPLAPLRAFKYTSAGGSRGGWKRNGTFDASRMDSVFRFGFDGKNPMSNKNLVFDEVHNMLALPRWKGTYWKEPLRRLRKAVSDSRGSTLVFLTGSPVQTDMEDGQRLLRVLKGSEHAMAGPEGWLDMHMERPPEFFPKVYPEGVPDRPLCCRTQDELVTTIDLPEEMDAKYREVEHQGGDLVRLRDCCNLSVHHTWALRPQKRPLMLEAAEQHALKLHAVAKAVWQSGEKAMAAVSRRGGLQVLKELLRRYAPDDHVQIAVFSGHSSTVVSRLAEEVVASTEALRRFNDARHMEVRVLLLDTAFGREGVSALGVGQLHLVDVPATWAEYKQTIGRAIRFGDVKEGGPRRSLQVRLWVARREDEDSADEVLLAKLGEQGEELCAAEDELRILSFE